MIVTLKNLRTAKKIAVTITLCICMTPSVKADSGAHKKSTNAINVEVQEHFPVPRKNRIRKIAKLLPQNPRGLGHPISDRNFWRKLAYTKQAKQVIKKANHLLNAPPLPVNKKQWMAYVEGKTDRQNYMIPFHKQGRRFNTLVLAEALQNKGRFIEKIEQILQHMLSLGTWKKPQSSGKVDRDYWYGRKHFVDLAIASRSFNVATADYWLQDELDPSLRKKLRKYIKKDALNPYLKKINSPGKEWWWMTDDQNWNAVCTSGIVGAGLSILRNRRERAKLIAGAEIGMRYYLKEFGSDGYSTEGVGYWSYGFGHFLALDEIVRINTQNKMDWLREKTVVKAALYPSRVEILNGMYPSYSDTHGVYSRPERWLMNFAKEHIGIAKVDFSFLRTQKLDDINELYYQGMLQAQDFPVCHFHGKFSKSGYHTRLRDFFPSGGLLIARPWRRDPRGMAVSIKGGNNNEDHNHDDLGAFEVVLGSKKLIIDPGSEVYGRHTFGKDRYKSEMMNSYGHSVPVVAGHLQSTGKEARAVITEKHFSMLKDVIKYNLISAYDVNTLENLTRSFMYERGDQSTLIVTDKVSYRQPATFETALIVATYNQAIDNHVSSRWESVGQDQWVIQNGSKAIKITISSPGDKIMFKANPLKAFRMPKGYNPIRLGFKLKNKVKSAQVRIKITPVKSN